VTLLVAVAAAALAATAPQARFLPAARPALAALPTRQVSPEPLSLAVVVVVAALARATQPVQPQAAAAQEA